MTLVTITYNAWDANRGKIPAADKPEIWFRPLTTSVENGLITDREVKGTLDYSTGAGQVQLESAPGLLYVPFLRWLSNPLLDEPGNRAFEYAEWSPFHPANGGPIDELPGIVPAFGAFFYGFGDPPNFLFIRNDVIWVDISGSEDGYWQPWAPAGTALEG
ncbi:hypothetical protein [Microbacterium sp. Root280D1]|uniref:hypothetical protein n=1 Tax=Microbacterium sp. Root280D1 TaxID=1736510 RepID=UPI0006FDCFB9|nr:hypothetical protein [Microbacterium sp. Root280D1]KRD51971.1 hypothetical protein ASE34_08625 [Microbacterium sp. Root280D1]